MAASEQNLPSTIAIFVDKKGRNELVGRIDRDLIIKHSKTVRAELEKTPTAAHFVITTATRGPVEHVLEFMKKGKQPLRIGVGNEEFAVKIAILQAFTALDIDRPQPQVENDIIYRITQFKLTPWPVEVVARASRSGTDTRIYRAVVQDIAYNVLHGVFTKPEVDATKKVAKRFPDLDAAVKEKIDDLRRRGKEHERKMAQRAPGRKAHKKGETEERAACHRE